MVHGSVPAVPAEARRKRVLIVHYFFPPLGGAGVPRILKFVKYLPAYGWDAVVVTTASTWYGVRDDSRGADVPSGTRVIRARELPVGPVRRRLLNPLHRLRLESLLSYVGWPDEQCGWFPAATVAALRHVSRWNPDILLTSSHPYTAHLVGLAVSRLSGVPWVADFRDEWVNNPFASPAPPGIAWLNARAEHLVTTRAARTVVVADWFNLCGATTAGVIAIPNGVDEEDFQISPPPPPPPPAPGRFRLTYVGTMYGPQDCAPVLAALRRLVDDRRLDPAGIEFRVVGNVWTTDLEELCPVPVSRVGYVDHGRALAEMSNASALLLYVAPSSRAPAGKLYEYLATGRPILCVARPDNLAYELVHGWNAGAVAPADDGPAIETAILDLYRRWELGGLEVSHEVRERAVARFSRKKLTGDLVEVFDAVASERAEVGGARRPGDTGQ
jgi:glycosyltransferase involved in cell wall biosynthesis